MLDFFLNHTKIPEASHYSLRLRQKEDTNQESRSKGYAEVYPKLADIFLEFTINGEKYSELEEIFM